LLLRGPTHKAIYGRSEAYAAGNHSLLMFKLISLARKDYGRSDFVKTE